jgi:RNA polymerase sigma-70 factor (ECF subfamily)
MDDREAVERCRAGEREAYRVLVERYEREAFAHAFTLLLNRADAEDAVQDAFVDAWRAIRRFDPSRRFYPWFYVILRNRCLKSRRGRSPERLDETLVVAATPEDRDLAGDFDRALRKLPAGDRELLTLHHLDGLGVREVAARIGVPEGTVMSRLSAARRRLREALGPRGKEMLQ